MLKEGELAVAFTNLNHSQSLAIQQRVTACQFLPLFTFWLGNLLSLMAKHTSIPTLGLRETELWQAGRQGIVSQSSPLSIPWL